MYEIEKFTFIWLILLSYLLTDSLTIQRYRRNTDETIVFLNFSLV